MTQPWVFTIIGTALVGLLAWLFQRAVTGLDKKIDDNCAQSAHTAAVVQEMRMEMTGYSQLVKYLSEDVKELKRENNVLRESHHVFDKYIAVQQALQKLPAIVP